VKLAILEITLVDTNTRVIKKHKLYASPSASKAQKLCLNKSDKKYKKCKCKYYYHFLYKIYFISPQNIW
jgi:hypothetical protein